MKPANLEAIQHSFTIQAPNFESQTVNFSKEEYLNYTISRVAPKGQDSVLEVAAGTCACGRSFAPLVQSVVCLDATPSMLQIGKQEAEKSHLNNMTFVKGYAEELPFLNDSFTIVFSRLAFHHFTDTDTVFSEMVRVLKPGGVLVMMAVSRGKAGNVSAGRFGFMILLTIYYGFQSAGINNAAHIGGIVCGIVLTLLLYPRGRRRPPLQKQPWESGERNW